MGLEELNALASVNHQKENNHTQLVARIVKVEPFSQSASIEDFPDFNMPLTRHEAAYEACLKDERDYSAECEAFIEHERQYVAHMEREFEDYYESEYGVSPYLDSIGLRRHVVDVGSEHIVALNEIVLAYHCCSQSLLRDSA